MASLSFDVARFHFLGQAMGWGEDQQFLPEAAEEVNCPRCLTTSSAAVEIG